MSNENVDRKDSSIPRFATEGDKGFYDNTYEKLLKKAGKTLIPAHVLERGFETAMRKMKRTRPEYTESMRELNKTPRKKYEEYEEIKAFNFEE